MSSMSLKFHLKKKERSNWKIKTYLNKGAAARRCLCPSLSWREKEGEKETWIFSLKGSTERQESQLCSAGWSGQHCGRSPASVRCHCHVTRPSEHLVRSSWLASRETEIDPRGRRELMLHRCCCGYVVACVRCVFVCVSALRSHDRDSGSAVISGATMRLAGADRSGGFMSNRAV